MLFFGPVSSIFDFITFGVMLWVFHAGPALFRSGWFVESLATQTLVIFAIRTRRIPFFRSRPSLPLALAALTVVTIGAVLPYTGHLARILGFRPLPALLPFCSPPLPAPSGRTRVPAPPARLPRAPPRRPLHYSHCPASPPACRRECPECFRCLMASPRGGSRSSTSR